MKREEHATCLFIASLFPSPSMEEITGGASFSDMMSGIVNTAGKISEKCWSCLWCAVVVSCVEVLTAPHEFIFAKHRNANCIREEAVSGADPLQYRKWRAHKCFDGCSKAV